MTAGPDATRIRRRARFYVESALAVAFALVTALLLWHPDWIEVLTGADPDHGSGAAEWALVIVSGTATLLVRVRAAGMGPGRRPAYGRLIAIRYGRPCQRTAGSLGRP